MKKLFLIVLFLLLLFLFSINVSALEESVYYIHSSLYQGYSIDLTGGIASNSNNIQMYNNNNSIAQQFKIEKIDDKYYTIKSMVNSEYNIDVTGSYYNDGTNIQLYQNNGYDSQKFMIEKDDGNNYSIISANNNYCLDIYNNNVILNTCSNSMTQKFKFEEIIYPSFTLQSGVYTISTSLNNNMFIGVQNSIVGNWSNVVLRDNIDNTSKWIIKYLDNGYYSIRQYSNNNYSLDVLGGSSLLTTNVQLYKYYESDAQLWIIHDNGDGYYKIISKCNNLLVDLVGGNARNNNNIQMYESNNSYAQLFKFNKVSDVSEKVVDDGTYFISPKADYNKLLDVTGANFIDGNNIQIYQGNYGVSQKWYIKYEDNNYYKLYVDYNRKYCLDVDNFNVVINTCDDLISQQWIIKKNDNIYYFVSTSGLYLDLYGNYTYNSNNIQVHEFNNSDAQKYNLRKTVSGISEQSIDNGIYMISSSLNNSFMIDLTGGVTNNANNIQLYATNGHSAQKWKITYLYNGYYEIVSLIDLTKSLDVSGAGSYPGTNVQLYDKNGSPAQQWILKDAGDGYYYIMSNCSGLYVDVTGGNAVNGNNIQMYTFNGSDAQKFKFLKSENETRIIDVSVHNGKIDWNKVKNSGIYGVILRIGYWSSEDNRFSEYISEVKRLGIPYGIYLFSYSGNTYEANIEADFTNQMISKYNLNPTLGIFYDLESWYISDDNNTNTITKDDYDAVINTYISNVSNFVGNRYKVGVYASTSYIYDRFNEGARKYVDWVADYRGYCGYQGNYSLWQYTSSGRVDGVNGNIDISYLR